jgi:D-aminopeptidase
MKILLDARLDPLYEAVMEATEEAILNSMCMATEMAGVNGHLVPALPLDEVRRFVDATRPIFAAVKKRPHEPAMPAADDVADQAGSQLGFELGDAPPTAVRSAEGIPYPTRSEAPTPAPKPDED